MLWLWVALYVLGGLALIVLILGVVLYRVGKSLPEEHSHTCTISLHHPMEQVYEVIADIAAWPAWDPGVQRVEGQNDAAGVFRGKMYMGRNVMGVEVTRVSPPTRHEIRVEDLGMKIFSGVWRYELTPTSDGCTIRLTEDGRIHSPIPRAMARRCADPRMYLKRHLRRLAEKFGEMARVE